MNLHFSRQFFAIAFLVSLPLGAMQQKANNQISKITVSYLNSLIKKQVLLKEKLTDGAPTLPILAMTPALPTAVLDLGRQAAQETSSTITIAQGIVAAGTGAAFIISAPMSLPAAIVIGGGVGIGFGIASFFIAQNESSLQAGKNTTFYAEAPTTATTTSNFACEQIAHDYIPSPAEVKIPIKQFPSVHPTSGNDPEILKIAKQRDVSYGTASIMLDTQRKREAAALMRKEVKKLPKAQIEKNKAKEEAQKVASGGPKKPDDEKKKRKINPDTFKRDLKENPLVKQNYSPHKNGNLKLNDRGIPLKDSFGREIHEMKTDFRHFDWEAIAKNGDHLGSIDPITLEVYKGAVGTRNYANVLGWLFGGVASTNQVEAAAPTEMAQSYFHDGSETDNSSRNYTEPSNTTARFPKYADASDNSYFTGIASGYGASSTKSNANNSDAFDGATWTGESFNGSVSDAGASVSWNFGE